MAIQNPPVVSHKPMAVSIVASAWDALSGHQPVSDESPYMQGLLVVHALNAWRSRTATNTGERCDTEQVNFSLLCRGRDNTERRFHFKVQPVEDLLLVMLDRLH
ncbi:hypothetical protein I5Q23_22770 [Serratia marcescens]|nr:hypothetical protein [Serratia marcescens]